MTPHLSTLALHRLRYGEIAGDERARAMSHLDGCDRCQARLAVQERERAAFVLEPVPRELRRVDPAREVSGFGSLLRTWWLPAGVVAVAAALLLVAAPALRSEDGAEPGNRIQYRGVLPAIEVWVDEGSGPRPLRPGEPLAEGDRVQLRYDAQGAPYVALAGRDSTGMIEVYTLAAPAGAGLLTAPFALELDDAPGEQELFVVTSADPLDEGIVAAAIAGPVSGVTIARIAFPKSDAP
jgi:hypothetical protein